MTDRSLSLFAFAFAAFLLVGCHSAQDSSPEPTAPPDRLPMVRIAVVIDKSGSAPRNRIPPMSPEQFKPFFDVLRERGGELAVGVIQEDSNRPLRRLRIAPPPPSPPPLPDNINPYDMERLSQYGEAEKKYQGDLERRRHNLEDEILTFQDRLKSILDAAPNAKRSDIGRAVARAELFLQEPTSHPHPIRRYGVLITDGADNVTGQIPPVESGATYVVVNGTGVLGVLDELSTRSFESPPAAFDFVSRLASGGGSQQ